MDGRVRREGIFLFRSFTIRYNGPRPPPFSGSFVSRPLLAPPPSLSLAQLSQSKWQFSMVKKLLESIERAFHIPSPVPLSRSGRGSMGSVEDKLGASTKETSLNRTGGQSVRRRHPTHPSLFKMASSKTNDLQMGARCIEMTMGGLLMVWLAFCHDATFKT